MIPNRLDLTLNRGAAFEMELVTQTKNYLYDPDVNNSPADLKRTHAENLDYYGFEYQYLDFATLYSAADLIVQPSWLRDGDAEINPLMHLQLNAGLTLTARSIQIGIEAIDTEAASFDKGVYKLLLTTALGRVDQLMFGAIEVHGLV